AWNFGKLRARELESGRELRPLNPRQIGQAGETERRHDHGDCSQALPVADEERRGPKIHRGFAPSGVKRAWIRLRHTSYAGSFPSASSSRGATTVGRCSNASSVKQAATSAETPHRISHASSVCA